jgi:ribonuclease P protein component
MTAFVLPNGLGHHRFGVTASRKLSRLAVGRNRAKRLLREAFRLSGSELDSLRGRYDWVFNARRPLLEAKAGAAVEELRRAISQLTAAEAVSPVQEDS